MRLTLRTLLAYLDDIVEPAKAKELGEKVQESPFASSLAERIREVTRRRRLLAPDVDGPRAGLDPNTIAEYLDNTLPTEAVADVERVCLESDVHLAEVAACHRVLTLVLGEPVDLLPESRERMYALAPTLRSKTNDSRQPAVDRSEIDDEASLQPHTATTAGTKPVSKDGSHLPTQKSSFADQIDYLKPRPWWRRMLPYGIVAVVVVGWLALIGFDFDFFKQVGSSADSNSDSTDLASADDDSDSDSRADADDADSSSDDANTATTNGDSETPGDSVASTDVDNRALPKSNVPIDPQPPADEPNDAVPNNPPVTVDSATADADATDADDNQPGADANPPMPPDAPAVAADAPPEVELLIQYVSPSGVLLRFDTRERAWYPVAHRDLIHPGETVAVPTPFEAVFDLRYQQVQADLLSGSVVRLLGPNESAPTGFDFRKGRVIIEWQAPAPLDDAPEPTMPLRLMLRGEDCLLELLTHDARLGLELSLNEPTQFETLLGANSYLGGIYVTAGSVRFTDGRDRSVTLSAGEALPLSPVERTAAELPAVSTVALPDWLSAAERELIPALRRYANVYERQFSIDESVSLTAPAMAKDDKPRYSQWAVECLALIEDYRALVKVLVEVSHPEAITAATRGLRRWLATDAAHGKLLKTELERRFPPDDVAVIYRLLWGFDEQDGQNQITATRLIEWLDHEHVAVRQMAFSYVSRLSGQTMGYSPLHRPTQRRIIVDRWHDFVDRNGGLVKK